MKKIVFLLVISLISCQSNRLEDYENKLTAFLIKNREIEKSILVLDTISLFQWDEVIVAGPYTDLASIPDYNFNILPNTIKSHDKFVLFGFILKKRGIKYFEIERSVISNNVFKNKGVNYKIYKKEESNLLISN